MSARNSRTKSVVLSAQGDLFPDMYRDRSVVQFPALVVRKRVVIERPAPAPVLRTCPTCSARFEDHTQRPNTLYCRSWCKTKMSYIKRDSAISLLATMPGMSFDAAFTMAYQAGLPKVEAVLISYGYRFERLEKAWVK